MSQRHIYTLPSGVPFLPALAEGIKARYGERLKDVLILLPTRRAVRELGNIFTGESGAALLPRMRPLADIDPSEPPFEPGDLAVRVAPAIPEAQYRFELATLVKAFENQMSDTPLDAAAALALVDPLLRILDDADMEEVSQSDLSGLKDISDFAAAHFQNAALLYDIIQTHWPKRLDELGYMSPMGRRVELLSVLADQWSETPPDYPVIIAGSTGTLKATARLMRCVSHMPDGMIVLPGLDKNLRTSAWDDVGPEHPQGALKPLLKTLDIAREDVRTWPWAAAQDDGVRFARRRLMSESLVPVTETADWPSRIATLRAENPTLDPFTVGLSGLSIIEAATDEEEALAIGLILRETLEDERATAALITPDPALARRVRAVLRRWTVDVDYSQGEPLEETSLGAYIAGLMSLAGEPDNPVHLAFCLKNPLTILGQDCGDINRAWAKLERQIYHGLRPKADVIKAKDTDGVVARAHAALSPYQDLTTALPSEFARALTQMCENFAGGADIWIDEAGDKAAALLENLIAYADVFGEMSRAAFAQLVSELMRGSVVRPRFGTHPRLQILGPLEARMLSADRIILGGLNEGVWPATPGQDPFLSRGMRRTLGLSLPERRYGLAAHDFAELAAHPHVVFTRSQRSDGGPMVASRWLWRLQTLLRGALGKTEAKAALAPPSPYLDWARGLDKVPAVDVRAATPPAPNPPLAARWTKRGGRQLSVTRITQWVRDPYSIYAQYILGLKVLEPLDVAFGARDYGNAMHDALEKIGKLKIPPVSRIGTLTDYFTTALQDKGFTAGDLLKEQPRLLEAARRMDAWMSARELEGWEAVGIEAKGELYIKEIDFTLTTKSDRIERGIDGFAVIDFKTGAPASIPVVKAGFDPQLPLTSWMIEEGAFEGIRGVTAQMLYVRISGTSSGDSERFITAPQARTGLASDDYIVQAKDHFIRLVTAFDAPSATYPSQPRAQYQNPYGDFDHLARRDEWAVLGNDSGGFET